MPLNTMRQKSVEDMAALRQRAESAIGKLERGEIVT